ncbi:hypothetical protein [Nocardioides caricicola]|uniref:Uncharacterized protein n=1 Tax=Nocardioides caricicola TaxID=634770 RepID=A0ABW0N2L8_9ACTN
MTVLVQVIVSLSMNVIDPVAVAYPSSPSRSGVCRSKLCAACASDGQEPTDYTSSAFSPPDGQLGSWTIHYLNGSGQKVYNTSAKGATWWDAQCPGSDGGDRYNHVKEYPRAKLHSRMVGTDAILYCGMTGDEGTEHAFGLRHLREGHQRQFAKYAAWEGRDWGSFMNWTVWHAIAEPNNVTNQSATRFCYEKQYIWTNPNGTQVKRTVAVILGETGRRVMSAWPRTNGSFTCKGNPIL